MRTLISLDPGVSTGLIAGTYSDTEPFTLTNSYQIPGGVEGFLGAVTYSFEWNGAETVGVLRLPGFTTSPAGPALEFICEKFTARGSANQFAYKTNDLEPLRIEGAILARGLDVTWVSPAQQYFSGGKDKAEKKKLQHRWLKENGFYIAPKEVGSKDADDARSATAHAISYLRRQRHMPTIEKYFPKTEESNG